MVGKAEDLLEIECHARSVLPAFFSTKQYNSADGHTAGPVPTSTCVLFTSVGASLLFVPHGPLTYAGLYYTVLRSLGLISMQMFTLLPFKKAPPRRRHCAGDVTT